MKVQVVDLYPPAPSSTSAAILALVDIELLFDNHQTLRINGIRVLRHRSGELWIGYPAKAIAGRYQQLFAPSRYFARLIEAEVLPAYKRWQAEQTKADAADGSSSSVTASPTADASTGGAR